MINRCMKCIALNKFIAYTNLCMEGRMPAWTNRTNDLNEKTPRQDCFTCQYFSEEPCCTQDGRMDIKLQIHCCRNWDLSMRDALDEAVRKNYPGTPVDLPPECRTDDDGVCYDAQFDGDGYFCRRSIMKCSMPEPNSAMCTTMPRTHPDVYSAQETTPEVYEKQRLLWHEFDECKRDPEVPDMINTKEPMFDWKTLGVDITIEYDRMRKLAKGAKLIYKTDYSYFTTKRWAIWFCIKESIFFIGRAFRVAFKGKRL